MGGCQARPRLTVAGLVEAVLRVAVRREDGDRVPAPLEGDGGVDDQALRPANAQVRVEEDGVLLLRGHVCAGMLAARCGVDTGSRHLRRREQPMPLWS
jgi:hypothetical protein